MTEHSAAPAAASDAEPVVIVGGGFAGLACAKELGAAGIETVLVDRNNYHLFVPLLYQVATAALSPADIAQPIRRILRRRPSVRVVMATATGVDLEGRRLHLDGQPSLRFGRLVLATGSTSNYFGHEGWSRIAPSPRDLQDATAVRSRILRALEQAETTQDAGERAALMSFVVVGGGPTGVEMAGSLAELLHHALSHEFKGFDPHAARIVLVEAGPRLLAAFPEELAAYARDQLEKLGIEVMTGTSVEDITEEGVKLETGLLRAATVIWGAGTRASEGAGWLGDAIEPSKGRIPVAPDLSVDGLGGRVFALGDVSIARGPDGQPLPALAQVAAQQGTHLGKALAEAIRSGTPMPPFRFSNRGNTAIVGRHAAVFDFGKGWRMRGRVAWLLWALVHIYLLNGMERRFLVATQWLVRYVTRQRGARLITGRAPSPEPPLTKG